MIKPINNGFIFKSGNIKAIQFKDRFVAIFNNKDTFEKIYVNTKENNIIRKIIEVFKK